MHTRRKQHRGITLIELVIVVSIVSILAAFAYPSYVERTLRTKRTDAKAALINIAGQQERFFFKNNRYATSLDELDLEETTQNEFYRLELVSDDASTFTATALPLDGQELDTSCAEFTIDQLGRKGADGDGDGDISARCWR